jgi:hypothetical protein
MRNLITNPPLPYTEFEVETPFMQSAKIHAGTQKMLLDLLTGKTYVRVSSIGQEPQNIPSTMILGEYSLNLDVTLAKVNGKMVQLNDDAGNGYSFYAEIL